MTPLRTLLRASRTVVVATLVLALGGHALPAAAQISGDRPDSASFVLDQSTLNAGGGSSTSASYVLDGSLSQPATVGNASSTSFIVQSGFWTSLATLSALRVVGTGTGDGTVTTVPAGDGIDCDLSGTVGTGDCIEKVVDGTTLVLLAVADPSNQFDGWLDCDSTSTTNVTGDTCTVRLLDSRTVTAIFTLQATLGDRVWRDIDGDGVQDAGEPGLDGITVELDDNEGGVRTEVTAGGGLYTFVDVPPGPYTVRVDTMTLPAGVVPTFDLDGTATPHEAAVELASGEDLVTADFGYQPLVDLVLTKVDDVDPLPGGQTLTYTLSVTNKGPGIATGVSVFDDLPVGTTLVATSGCAEDPAGVPTCTLGMLGIGQTATYTIEVSIDPAPPASITNTATASSIEVDTAFGDNTDSETTALDADPPAVDQVTTTPPAPGGTLDECETLFGNALVRVSVAFDEPMLDPAGDTTPGDITNLDSWSLVEAGPDRSLQTTSCATLAGDDRTTTIASVSYDEATRTARVDFPQPIQRGLYRLFACGDGADAVTDLGGTPLDGDSDGAAGGDFALRFRVDARNQLGGGFFDCDLEPWTVDVDQPQEIVHASFDRESSADSGSARIERLGSQDALSLAQCAELVAGDETTLELGAWLYLDVDDGGFLGIELNCRFFDGAGCSGGQSALAGPAGLLDDTEGNWLQLHDRVTAPAGTQSARCGLEVANGLPGATNSFEAFVDQIWLTDELVLFADGFERGDTSAWSSTVE